MRKRLQENRTAERVLPGMAKSLARECTLPSIEFEAQNEVLRRLQLELEASRSRYAHLCDLAPFGYFTLDQKSLIVEANLRGAEQLGMERPRLLQTLFSLYLTEESRLPFMACLKKLFKSGSRQFCRAQLHRRDRSTFNAHIECILVDDPVYGRICRMTLRETSPQRGGDEASLDSERAYRLLFESHPHPMWVFDTETLAFLAVNEAAVRHYGYSRDEFLSMTVKEILSKEEIPAFLKELSEVRPRVGQAGIWRHRKKDGSVIEVEMTAHRIFFSERRAMLVVAKDVTARMHAEADLRESERRFRALIEKSSDVITLLNSGGKIFYASPSTLRIFGYSPEELLGKTPLELIHPDHWERAKRFFSDLTKEAGKAATTELQFRHRDGSWHWIEGTGTNLLQDPSIRAIVVNYRDITDRKEAEASLQERNMRLEEASRARNRFFSYMSHELKTPINSIVGFTQLLLRGTYGPLTPKQTGAVGRIHNNARELIHLINNILDLARFESGKKGRQVVEVDLRELAEKVLVSFEPLLQEKGLWLRKEMTPDLPQPFLTDPMQVRSILTNLLSNAVKFTEQGEVGLRLSRQPEGDGVVLEVSDTGAGISPEYLERIFEEYEQRGVVRETDKYAVGSGLGLAIVKRMVDSLKGTIKVASTPGRGTIFTVFLPELAPSNADRSQQRT